MQTLLINSGIAVFTESNKKVIKGDFSKIRVSYGVDWFDIKGTIYTENEQFDVADLIDLKDRVSSWAEVNGKIFFIPETLNSVLKSSNKSKNGLKIDKSQFVSAIDIAYETTNHGIDGLEQLECYEFINFKIENYILSKLRDYQKTGVKWLLSLNNNGFGGCLADDMGLGK